MQTNMNVEIVRERPLLTYKGFKIKPVVFKVSGKESDALEFLRTLENLKWNINMRKLSAVSMRTETGGLNAQLILDLDVLYK